MSPGRMASSMRRSESLPLRARAAEGIGAGECHEASKDEIRRLAGGEGGAGELSARGETAVGDGEGGRVQAQRARKLPVPLS